MKAVSSAEAPVARVAALLLGVEVQVLVPQELWAETAALLARMSHGRVRPSAANIEHVVRLEKVPSGWRVDGVPALASNAGDCATALLTAALTHIVAAHTRMLAIHAGVMVGPAGTLVVPGQSGHGKSTLVASAVQAGLGYASDEVLAIDRATGELEALPRPLLVDDTAWRLLGLPEASAPSPGHELEVPSAHLGQAVRPVGPVHVLLTRRAPGATQVAPTRRSDAVVPLLNRAFNHFKDPHSSLETVVRLARAATVWQATYEDAPDLAPVLARAMGVEGGPIR